MALNINYIQMILRALSLPPTSLMSFWHIFSALYYLMSYRSLKLKYIQDGTQIFSPKLVLLSVFSFSMNVVFHPFQTRNCKVLNSSFSCPFTNPLGHKILSFLPQKYLRSSHFHPYCLSSGCHQQNKKATYLTGEDIFKWYPQQGANIQSV